MSNAKTSSEAAKQPSGRLICNAGWTVGETRLAELIATLSLATDLGMGQPMEFALRVAILGVGLANRAGLGSGDKADIYYLALIKHIGCTSDAFEFAGFVGGDDVAFRHRAMLWPATPKPQVLTAISRYTGEDRPALERAKHRHRARLGRPEPGR